MDRRINLFSKLEAAGHCSQLAILVIIIVEIFVYHSQLLYMVLTIVYGTALPWEFASKLWISIGLGFEKILLSHYNEFCFDAGRCCAASSSKINLRWWPV